MIKTEPSTAFARVRDGSEVQHTDGGGPPAINPRRELQIVAAAIEL